MALRCWELMLIRILSIMPLKRFLFVSVLILQKQKVIKRLGIFNMDIVIVSMANNLEASVMAVTLCKEAGVETVIAKCASEMQEKILKRVGADRVVFPERESGIRLGRSLITSGFSEMI